MFFNFEVMSLPALKPRVTASMFGDKLSFYATEAVLYCKKDALLAKVNET